MRIEIIDESLDKLQRERWIFDARFDITDRKLVVHFTSYYDEKRISRRHRNWYVVGVWHSRSSGRTSNADVPRPHPTTNLLSRVRQILIDAICFD
jgi:hypothetical protein